MLSLRAAESSNNGGQYAGSNNKKLWSTTAAFTIFSTVFENVIIGP